VLGLSRPLLRTLLTSLGAGVPSLWTARGNVSGSPAGLNW